MRVFQKFRVLILGKLCNGVQYPGNFFSPAWCLALVGLCACQFSLRNQFVEFSTLRFGKVSPYHARLTFQIGNFGEVILAELPLKAGLSCNLASELSHECGKFAFPFFHCGGFFAPLCELMLPPSANQPAADHPADNAASNTGDKRNPKSGIAHNAVLFIICCIGGTIGYPFGDYAGRRWLAPQVARDRKST